MERERRAPAAAAALWGHKHLHLLARAGSKESLEYILQALWRTRRTGLDAADRAVVRDALQLASYAEIDPAVRQRGRLQGRHPQALPRRGAARVAEAAHVAAAEVPARVAGGCFKGSGIYPTYRHCRMSVEPEWRHIRAASCF
ncbi:uncharacterized protein LOC120712960 isoform X2 [Panicum virgatum]|uniref:uncharacterized protein LOC120712960 isoform X2 n=1 Tax=Panicum virgatum TaxID=38727 RepID=UPI0019D52D43|nr:uncharacterized protein LOC120712960 isoform X2 [Panicum virgatum]